MSEVRFSANPSAVLRSLNEIQSALRKTAQEGKRFSELDFGSPELAAVVEDMKRLQAQLDAFKRIAPGSNLARGLRNSGQGNAEPWNINWAAAFPDPAQRRQAQARFSQLPGQFGAAALGAHAEQRQSGPGLPGFIPSTPMGAVGALVGLALGSSVSKAVSEGMANARAHDASADQALRWSNVARDFETLRREIGGVGKGLGVIESEGAKLAMTFARSSGAVDGAADGARTALGLAAGLGMNPESTAQRLGAMRFMGVTDGASKTSQREFVGMFAEMVGRTGMGARGEEVLSDLASSMQRMTQQYLRPTDISALMQFATGIYGSDNPAVRARGVSGMAGGAETLTGYDGNDLERSMLHYRALGDLTTNQWMLRRMTERGPFSRPGELVGSSDTRTLFEMAMEQVDQDTGPYADPQMKSAYLAGMAGTSMDEADELVRLYEQFGSAGIGSLQARLKAAGVDLESMSDVSGISGAARVMAAEGDPQALRALMEQTIEDRKLTDAKADELRGLSGNKLADALIRLEAEGGRTSTPTSDLNEAIRKLSDDFAQLGNELNGAKLDLVESMGALTDPLNKLVGFWEGVGDAVEGKSLWDDGGIGSALTYSPWLFGAIDLGKKAFSGAKSSRSGRSGRNRRTGEPQEAEEAPAMDSGSPLLDWLFKPAEASALPFASAFDINQPLSPAQRMQRALPAPAESATVQAAKSGALAQTSDDPVFAGVDPRLVDVMLKTMEEFPLRSQVYSGKAGRGKGKHADGKAVDLALFDQNGVRLPNYQDGTAFRAYEMFAQQALLNASDMYPELVDGKGEDFNWGGLFGDNGKGGYKYGSNDAMHFALDDNAKFRASGATQMNPLRGLDQKYRGWYDEGDLLGGSKEYDPVTFAKDWEKLGKFKLSDEQRKRLKYHPSLGRIDDIAPVPAGADMDASSVDDRLPKEIVGDQVSQRIGTSVRQDPSPPVSLSLNLFQNPVTGAFHVEADREGSGTTRIAYGSGRWTDARPRQTA